MKIKKFNELNESYLLEEERELLQHVENVGYLKDALEYTITQIRVLKSWCDDDGKEYADSVLEEVKKMLKDA
jgi:hypothetical protein